MHRRLYDELLNGVYKAGIGLLKGNKPAAAEAAAAVYAQLGALETALGTKRFLMGKALTAVDIRLTMTYERSPRAKSRQPPPPRPPSACPLLTLPRPLPLPLIHSLAFPSLALSASSASTPPTCAASASATAAAASSSAPRPTPRRATRTSAVTCGTSSHSSSPRSTGPPSDNTTDGRLRCLGTRRCLTSSRSSPPPSPSPAAARSSKQSALASMVCHTRR